MLQKENNKIKVIKDKEKDFYGIGFYLTNYITIEQIKKINLHFIKYAGKWSLSNDNQVATNTYVVKFENMPKHLLDSVCETIIEKVENENLSEDKALNFVIDLFQKFKFKKEIKEKLIGDIGELIFMIKAKEVGINADQKIRLSDNNLYDFVFDKFYLEVKSSSKNLSEIIVDLRQIEEAENKKFVVSKFQLLENQLTILDLYNKLNSNNELILKKKKEYLDLAKDEMSQKILLENTIDLNKVECFVLEDQLVPKIKIIHEGGLKKVKCHIGITNCQKISLEELKKM